jgi:hypothetical protein
MLHLWTSTARVSAVFMIAVLVYNNMRFPASMIALIPAAPSPAVIQTGVANISEETTNVSASGRERDPPSPYIVLEQHQREKGVTNITGSSVSMRMAASEGTNTNVSSSPACYPSFLQGGQRIQGIYFHHMRKAGGTTLFEYFRRVAKKYGLFLRHIEGGPAKWPKPNRNALYVTNLREPVARAISHFKYSGRWQCNQLRKKDFVPTEANAVLLETFIKEEGGDLQRTKWPTSYLWECAQNCYTRWAAVFPGANMTDLTEGLVVARQRLLQYNLIFTLEKARDPNYIRGLERMFNVSWPEENPKVYCADKINAANEKAPPVIQNETTRELRELNKVDTMLYNELTACPNGIEFPEFDRSKFKQ